MKKILKISGIVILVLLVFYLAMGIYKYNIISKQSKAYNEFRYSENAKYTCNDETVYFRDGISKVVRKNEDGSESGNMYYMVYDSNVIMAFEFNKTFNIASFGTKNEKNKILISNYHGIDLEIFEANILQKLILFWEIANGKISSEIYEGKECYKYTISLDKDCEDIMYIDKETYLPVYVIETLGNQRDEYRYSYEVNCVTEAELQKPDLSEYTQNVH